jgi:tetratricopeptide (TPR) repeat protein
LANALYQAGRLPEAEVAFRQAEEMQKERHPQYPLLYSLRGYLYCDLLLGQGKIHEVLERADTIFKWRKLPQWNPAYDSLLDIALDDLSLGRAYLLQAQQEGTEDSSQATAHLDRAVDGLRQAGTQHHIPRGLLARAELRRAMDDVAGTQQALEEALSIATRGGMRLHEADCHLEYARLHLACGEEEKARQSLAKVKEMIQEMGYHRRNGEVAELEGVLGPLKH